MAMNRIIKYGLIVVRDKKFLVNRKKGTKLFLLPGGRPKSGESIEECLARELEEEHRCELKKETLVHIGDFEDAAANEPDTTVFIKVYSAEMWGTPIPSAEIEEQRWFGMGSNPLVLSPIIKNKILPVLIEKGII